jgi:hypothetical protein
MEEQPPKKDIWEKIGIILQSSGGLLTALSVALIGMLGSSYLKDRELSETKTRERIQLQETRTRIYTELMSKREESESALRKDMFISIIGTFLKPGTIALDERVLNLELLAYNFHESLNLKPLFTYLEKQIEKSGETRKQEYLGRLYKVATEISRKQMLVLEGAGQKTDLAIDLGNLKENPGGFPLEDASLTLDGITRQFSLRVLAADKKTREINIRMEIKTPTDDGKNIDTHNAEFWVGFFDFPMIDNTRLPHDQRVAVILNAFEDGIADITLAYFPGSYASLKEKPYYGEVIQNLIKADAKMQDQATPPLPMAK